MQAIHWFFTNDQRRLPADTDCKRPEQSANVKIRSFFVLRASNVVPQNLSDRWSSEYPNDIFT